MTYPGALQNQPWVDAAGEHICSGGHIGYTPHLYRLWLSRFLPGPGEDARCEVTDEQCRGIIALMNSVPRLNFGASSSEWIAVRLTAARILGALGSEPARRSLCYALPYERSPEVIEVLVAGIQKWGNRAAPDLVRSLESISGSSVIYPEGLTALLQMLGAMGDQSAAIPIARKLGNMEVSGRVKCGPGDHSHGIIVATVALVGLLGLTLLMGSPDDPPMGAAAIVGRLVFVSVLAIIGIRVGNTASERRLALQSELYASATDALEALGSRRCIPTLLVLGLQPDMYLSSKPHVRRALSLLLPRIGPDDADLIVVEGHRTILARGFAPFDSALTLACLHAITQAGSPLYLPHVQRLLRDTVDRDVAAAAHAAISVLEERARKERQASFLVRPGQAPQDSADTLLRPSMGHADQRPEELLRARGGGDL